MSRILHNTYCQDVGRLVFPRVMVPDSSGWTCCRLRLSVPPHYWAGWYYMAEYVPRLEGNHGRRPRLHPAHSIGRLVLSAVMVSTRQSSGEQPRLRTILCKGWYDGHALKFSFMTDDMLVLQPWSRGWP